MKEAEQNYRNINERYEKYDTAELNAFYIRNADKDPQYKIEGDKLTSQAFPGLKKVQLADFKTAPDHGVVITSADDLCPESPIKKDVVMVAVNGYLVENILQLHVARNIPNTSVLTAIIWDGKNYVESRKPVVNNNFFNVGLQE